MMEDLHSDDGRKDKVKRTISLGLLGDIQSCNEKKVEILSMLDEWCAHREKLEDQLRGLAWDLDCWEKGTNTAIAVGSFTGIGAGAMMVAGVVFPPLALGGLILGGAAAATNITTSIVKKEHMKGRLSSALALLEGAKHDTENFVKTTSTLLSTCAPIFARLENGVNLEISKSSSANRVFNTMVVKRLVGKISMPSRPTGLLQAVSILGLTVNIVAAIKVIQRIIEGNRSKVASKLRAIVDQMRMEREEFRILLTNHLPEIKL